MQRILLRAIRLYQRGISPALGARCRFEPTCSHYAYEAIATHGSARGSWLALRRLLRCRPGHPGGYDPVPARTPNSANTDTATANSDSAGVAKTYPGTPSAPVQHPKIVKY